MNKQSYFLVTHLGAKPHSCIDVYTDDPELIRIAVELDCVRYADYFERSGMTRLHLSPLYDEQGVLETLKAALDEATLSDVWKEALDELDDDDSAEQGNE